MSSYKSFLVNLNKARPFEIEAYNRIYNFTNKKLLSYNDNYKYDFMTEDLIKYEVKSEPASYKTNNYFVEFLGYNKKPSGIETTEADYYIFTNTIDKLYYMIETKKLKVLCKENGRIIENKLKNATAYLMKCELINKNSILI